MFKVIALFSLLLCLGACMETRDEKKSSLNIGAKMELQEWPDAAYIQAMDSMLKAEVVVGPKSKNDVSVSLGSQPMALGDLVQKAGKDGEALAKKSAVAPRQTTEQFLSSFSEKIEKVRAGGAKGRAVQVKTGENIRQLLIRTYGAAAKQIPDVVVQYQLQGINPGKDLTDLSSVDQILLPF